MSELFGSSAVIAALREKSSIDESLSYKTYKKAKKQYIASIVDDKLLANISAYFAEYKSKLEVQMEECMALPHTDIKPDTKGMTKTESYMAYLPYNNGRRINQYLKGILQIEVSLQNMRLNSLKSIYDSLFERFLDSLRGKYPGEIVSTAVHDAVSDALGNLPSDAVGQVLDALRYSGIIGMEKIKSITHQKQSIWMVKVNFTNYIELFTLRRRTQKNYSLLVSPPALTKESFVVSQRKWRYGKVELSNALVDTLNKAIDTAFCFADYVDADYITDSVLKSGLPESEYNAYKRNELIMSGVAKDSDFIGTQIGISENYKWIFAEVTFALEEWERIMNGGNRFYIDRFVDGVNRIYEKKTYFGFQGIQEFRQCIRFYNKKSVTPEGMVAYAMALESLYGSCNIVDIEEKHGDMWGYIDAIKNPTKPTGAIVFQDATTQGTQLYGIATGSELLLRQSGAWDLEGEELIKAYLLLSKEMNEALSVWDLKNQYEENKIYALNNPDKEPKQLNPRSIDCFTVENVKAINMTKLYNVGRERILTGKGFIPESQDDFDASIITPQFEDDYERDLSKLGKLRPLMMTVLEYGLNIDQDEMWKIFSASIRSIAGPALDAMAKINGVVKPDDKTEIFEWKSQDGTINRYAMVSHQEDQISWITEKGTIHSYTHKYKTLVPGFAWRGVAPRIIQGEDAYLVRYVYNNTNFDLVTIHDSYGSHGNDAKETKYQYIEGLVSLYEHDYLTDTLSQLSGRRYQTLQSQDPVERERVIRNIRKSKYALDFA